jgi:hypothetical protein
MVKTLDTKKQAKIIDLDSLIPSEDEYFRKLNLFEKKVLEKYRLRKSTVHFKLNDKIYDCSLANLITQMILFIPFTRMHQTPDEEFVILDEIQDFNKNTCINYFNNLINYELSFDIKESGFYDNLNLSIKESINHMSDLSGLFNVYSGSTINLYDLVHLYSNNNDFKTLVDEEVPSGLDFSEIEDFVDNEFKSIMKILKNEDTCFKNYFNAQTGINEKQFKEIISKIALKADLDGNIIPYVIDTNYIKGLRNVTDFYIVSILARKALITSHRRVKDSGYLTRKLTLLLIDTFLSTEEDCDSEEYAKVNITNKDVAKRYNLRYFLNEKENCLERFDDKIHKDLIGSTLKFRTPIKCKCHDGKVCHTCYGDLANVNNNIHIGILAVLELTEQLTQKLK